MAGRSLTVEEARAVDRRAVEAYGMPSLILMENAGRGCADRLERRGVRGPVVVCCGKGANGGDGFVIARHLELRGRLVRVALWADPAEVRGDAAVNLRILQLGRTPLDRFDAIDDPSRLDQRLDALLDGADWIVDALLGTGSQGEPRSPLDHVIRRLNAAPARRLAVDLPSGLDADSGRPARTTFQADVTCTFVAPKRGFDAPEARPWLGEVEVCDIGVPRRLLDETLAGTPEV